jgi:hypothetical protein
MKTTYHVTLSVEVETINPEDAPDALMRLSNNTGLYIEYEYQHYITGYYAVEVKPYAT